MENGEKNVEEEVMKLKAEGLDGYGVKGVDRDGAFAEASGGGVGGGGGGGEDESVENGGGLGVPLELDGGSNGGGGGEDESVENGGGLGVSVGLDGPSNGGQGLVDKCEDGTETLVLAEEPCGEVEGLVEVEDVTSAKVIDGKSPSEKATNGGLSGMENEGKVLDSAESIDKKTALSDQLSGVEADASVGDGNYDAEVLNLKVGDEKNADSSVDVDEKSTSEKSSRDQTRVLEADELVGDGNNDAKVLSLQAVDEKITSDKASRDQTSGLEADEFVGDGNIDGKVFSGQNVDGKITSDKASVDQLSRLEAEKITSDKASEDQPSGLEADESVGDGNNDAEVSILQDVDEKNTSDKASSDQPSLLEVNESVDDGDNEAKLVNSQANDEKSASDETDRGQPSGLETGEPVNNGNDQQTTQINVVTDETNVLENNGAVDNGVNEAQEASERDSEESLIVTSKDVDEVNKNPVAVVTGNLENGVLVSDNGRFSENLDVGEAAIHEDLSNGDADGEDNCELEIEPNGDATNQLHKDGDEKDVLGISDKDDESMNQEEIVEDLRDNLVNIYKGIKVEEPNGEEKLFDDQGDRSVEIGAILAVEPPDNGFESPKLDDNIHEAKRQVSLEAMKDEKSENVGEDLSDSAVDPFGESEPKDNEVKQSMPLSKEPESRPVIGVSLSTSKSAVPSNPKPNPSPVPSSKSITPPAAAPTHPAGLGSGAPLLEHAPRVVQSQVNGNVSALQNQVIDEPTNGEAEENDDTREKLQMIRVKFLRLARRLGQTPHNVVVAQVLYRLGLAEQLRGRNGGRVAAFSFERASAMAEQLEAVGQEPLEFSCTIMVLGKTGVGKSATINSIFDEVKFGTDAFQMGTKKVQDVVGTVQGIKVRVIDTPGLLPSWADQRKNEKILHSVKRFIQKSPPDIVLYLDRLDMQSRDFGDMPLLRTITDIFGPSIWFNAIVVLTHAASAPPEGPNGTATSYDMFVTQRSHVVQQAIRQAAGDMRLMNPVSLVENHSACRTNRAGQRVLPNGQVWKPHLLLLSFASKILVEANMLLKLQDSPPGKPFAARNRAPPLPFILLNLLQSKPQLKLPNEQFGGDDDDDDLDESSDEESSEYDELPPFKRLTNAQLAKLSSAQRKAYHDELEYREKLFMKKQLKEEKRRRKMMKKMAEEAKNLPTDFGNDDAEEDSNGAATVPVAVQDMNLPASFDSDNPTHRYRALDSANQWLIRPVLDPHGWDHDVGYEGINMEHLLAVKDTIPVSFSGQVTKDKKDANLQMEVAGSVKHGKAKSTTVALDMQTVGKEISYTLRSETRFVNFRRNKASAGFSASYFGDALTGGVKFEDKLTVNKRGQLVVAGGAVIGRGDVAYGGSLEATLRDKDYPLGRFLSTVGLSVMDWHGDLALGWNAQSQIPIGRFTNLIGRLNLNNKGSGQVSVRVNSSEQLQIALVALVPLVSKVFGYCQPRDSTY